MTAKDQIEEVLKSTGVEYRFDHFETEEAVAPPFICYTNPETRNYYADGKIIMTVCIFNIELYCDRKNEELENIIERGLDGKGIGWSKAEQYIEEEDMYEVIYEMEVRDADSKEKE